MYSNNADQAFGLAGLRHCVGDVEAIIDRCRSTQAVASDRFVDDSLLAEIWDDEPSLHVPTAKARSTGDVSLVGPTYDVVEQKPQSTVVPVLLSVAAIVFASVMSVSLLGYFEHSEQNEPEVGSLQLTEEAPPVGRGRLLNPPQIRYCIAQGIRLGAASEASSALAADDVAELEAQFSDYDDRCAEYRFQAGAFDVARRDVEVRRAALEHEGSVMLQKLAVIRAASSQPEIQALQRGDLSTEAGDTESESSRLAENRYGDFDPTPRKYVKDLQWRLFKLKYYTGPIDGVDSVATQNALRGFFSVHDEAADATDENTIFQAVDSVYQQR